MEEFKSVFLIIHTFPFSFSFVLSSKYQKAVFLVPLLEICVPPATFSHLSNIVRSRILSIVYAPYRS